jgi:hypothetical protein
MGMARWESPLVRFPLAWRQDGTLSPLPPA